MLASYGMGIASAMYNEQVEQSALGEGGLPVYPEEGQYKSSTDYFNVMAQSNVLTDFPPWTFAVPGRMPARETHLLSSDNAWCVVLGHGDDASGQAPLLFSRNAVFSKPGLEATLNDIMGVSEQALPGIRSLVVVYRGGSVRVFSDKEELHVGYNSRSRWAIKDRSPYRKEELPQKFNPSGKPMKFLSP